MSELGPESLGAGFKACPRVPSGLGLGWACGTFLGQCQGWTSSGKPSLIQPESWVPLPVEGQRAGLRGSQGALLGHLRVTAWSRMDVGPFRPGVVEVRPQPFLSTFSLVCCGPIDLCIRQTLRLVDRPHPKWDWWCHLQPLQSLPFWRLAGHPLVLDLIVYASVEINPLFPSNRFILEACRLNRDSESPGP